jgi:hypothetical protein
MLQFFSISVVLLAILYNILPSALDEPTLWKNIPPLQTLDGLLSPNTILQNIQRLNENEVTAPESMAIDEKTGNVFTGLNDGRVVMLNQNGKFLKNIFFVGGYITAASKSEQISPNFNGIANMEEKLSYCMTEARAKRLHHNVEEEKSCGRPLGMRIFKVTTSIVY